MTRAVTPLTASDADQLADCERTITAGMRTFVAVGEALCTIRDRRLYRATHGTFEEYCRERWSFSTSRARQLISAAKTVTTVTLAGGAAPTTEAQARELAGLQPHQAAITMRVAAENGSVTAASIKAARLQPWTDAEATVAVDHYLIDPKIAVFPPFRPHEWAGLADSINTRGLIQPIMLSTDGKRLIDGRFRYFALRWNGIDPLTATTVFGKPAVQRLPANTSEADFIIAVNVLRQHREVTAEEAREAIAQCLL